MKLKKTEEQLKILADSSDYALSLLENLLIWSRSQTEKLEFNGNQYLRYTKIDQ